MKELVTSTDNMFPAPVQPGGECPAVSGTHEGVFGVRIQIVDLVAQFRRDLRRRAGFPVDVGHEGQHRTGNMLPRVTCFSRFRDGGINMLAND